MNDITQKSQVRFSEYLAPELPPLCTVEEIKDWFGISSNTWDVQLPVVAEAVSLAIRGYTGRGLTEAEYQETFTDVTEIKGERYLREIPVLSVSNPADIQGFELINTETGRVNMPGGPEWTIIYTGGYDPLPADLKIVFMTLVQMQMATMGFDIASGGGGSSASSPQERAVTVGTLKVEYAVTANSAFAKASTAGGLTADALAPWSEVLDRYSATGRWIAT